MIFYISEEITEDLNTDDASLINGLQSLADGRRCGKIEIIGNRNTLQKISEYSHLSSTARGVYERLFEKCTTSRSLLDNVEIYVDVKKNVEAPTKEEAGNGQVKISVPIKWIGENKLEVHPPILLCENLDDCNFYKYFGDYYKKEKRILGIDLNFEKQNGGGATTCNVFEDIMTENKKLCLCIVDSDKKYCGCQSLGQTAKSVEDRFNRKNTPIVDLHILTCHEAENLIPLTVLGEIYDIDEINEVLEKSTDDCWKYIDFKEGLPAFKLKNHLNEDFKNYWTNNIPRWDKDCLTCKHKCDEECTKNVYSGFGDNVLKTSVDEFFSKNSTQKVSEKIREPYVSLWSEIGRLIFSWGVVGEKVRA